MRRILLLLFLSLTTYSFAQNVRPTGTNFKPVGNSFYYYTPDSTVWLYKSSVYGWSRLATYKNLKFQVDSIFSKVYTRSQTDAIFQPLIPAGTTAQYWAGNKGWSDFNSSSRSAISLTTTGSSGAATYTPSTGVLNIPSYSFSETDPSVYAWAKASTKPSYVWSEIGSKPTNLSSFTNDLGNYGGWITGYTETDPTIYAWAKASTKPSYAWSEIGSKPSFATVATSGSYADLSSKPTIPAAQINSDWTASSGVSQIVNKPTKLSSFTNDLGNYGGWITGYSETDPTIYAWAKASSKPSYAWSEIGSRPTNLSSFTNDLGNYGGWITGYTETDPTIYGWAKLSTKPSYAWSEIGSRPTNLSSFTNDLGNYGGWVSSESMVSYVPYSGASYNVDLGSHTLTTTNVISASNFQLSSDSTLKQNIKALRYSKFPISFYSYSFKADSTNEKRYGVIAQEVQKYDSTLIKRDSVTGKLQVKYIDLIIKVLSNNQIEIASLKSALEKQAERGRLLEERALKLEELLSTKTP